MRLLSLCCCKRQIDVSFSFVCPVIESYFHHNIVRLAVDPPDDSRVDLQTTLTICYHKNQIHNSFSCVCSVIDNDCHYNIVEVACQSSRLSVTHLDYFVSLSLCLSACLSSTFPKILSWRVLLPLSEVNFTRLL